MAAYVNNMVICDVCVCVCAHIPSIHGIMCSADWVKDECNSAY